MTGVNISTGSKVQNHTKNVKARKIFCRRSTRKRWAKETMHFFLRRRAKCLMCVLCVLSLLCWPNGVRHKKCTRSTLNYHSILCVCAALLFGKRTTINSVRHISSTTTKSHLTFRMHRHLSQHQKRRQLYSFLFIIHIKWCTLRILLYIYVVCCPVLIFFSLLLLFLGLRSRIHPTQWWCLAKIKSQPKQK